MLDRTWFDCVQCGRVDRMSALEDHPTRPMPTDVGFCPSCHCEVDELISEAEAKRLVVEEYGHDWDSLISQLDEGSAYP